MLFDDVELLNELALDLKLLALFLNSFLGLLDKLVWWEEVKPPLFELLED
tara:strand:+ start:401 stop:550 length:150 start_codon:yes stop_codon:yes gene_type:complete